MGKFFNFGIQNTTPSSPEAQKYKDIATAFKNRLTWKWDDRFDAVLAEFSVGDKDKIRTMLDQHFNSSWDISTATAAPENVRAAAELLGGLMGEQKLLISALDNGTLVYCAWWPWGNGKTISVRIAPFPSGGNPFKSYFGL